MELKNIYNYPNLPVDSIDDFLARLTEWVKPLLTENEYTDAIKIISKYKESKDSINIQNILLERSKDKNSSWLIDWWIKYMYLTSRGPVTPECNAPMIFRNENILKYDLSELISLFIYKISDIYLDVFNNKYKIIDDQLNPKKKYSLDQLIYLFASFREPNIAIDSYYTNENLSDYVIILKNNVIYQLKIINDNKIIDLNQIRFIVDWIINNNDQLEINLNFITCFTNRDFASNIINKIVLDKTNSKIYDIIKNSIFAISIDLDANNDNVKKIFKNFLSASDYNRLHGKSLLINFDKNKNICFCADHSKVDGGTEIYLMMKVYEYLDSLPKFNVKTTDNKIDLISNYVNIHKMNDTNNYIDIFKHEYKKFIDYVNMCDIKWNKITRLNRLLCKELNIISPDGFIQLMFQLAQYKTNKKLENIYVAVDVRNFFKGRTECIRPISNESKQFVIDFIDNGLNDKNEIIIRLQSIYNIHYKRSKECQNGNGINRYLLGIKLAYEENKNMFDRKPEIIDSLLYKKISNNFLSTSSITSPCIDWVYFDPVVIDGLGIFYAMDEKDFRYCISGWAKDKNYHEQFFNNLEIVTNQIIDILESKE